MSGISLTASMRSNLLSLQNIASQQDIVQNRLATGLKVSSAIDNPSSYYTASSLNNRAADLTALLDAMSQGIQTIKAASEAIDSGTKFLEQAKAVASSALSNSAGLPDKQDDTVDYAALTKLDKSWYQQQVGANGAVVSTEQELRNAVAAGKETIVIYGNISVTKQINIADNQKIVGTEYFADIDPNARYRENHDEYFSQITADMTGTGNVLHVTGDNCIISDLKITMNQQVSSNNAPVYVYNAKNVTLQNLDLTHHAQSSQSCGIVSHNSETKLNGKINIDSSNDDKRADIGIYNIGKQLIIDNADITIKADFMAIATGSQALTEITNNSKLNINSNIAFYENSLAFGGNTTLIDKSTKIEVEANILFNIQQSSVSNKYTGQNDNYFLLEEGVTINWKNKATEKSLYLRSKDEWTLSVISTALGIEGEDLARMSEWHTIKQSPTNIVSDSQTQYINILAQYNMLISDAFYKGINLLEGQNLKINFNEDRSSKIEVTGVNADSDNLGLKTKEWNTVENIEKSISELERAIGSLRGFATEFGNYYSIVTTRQDFTENLINVLEEGADKLTLADMNQESANMLALQTAQQLAVNSLSLASQASQSILRLF